MSQPREHDEPGQPELLPGLARAAAQARSASRGPAAGRSRRGRPGGAGPRRPAAGPPRPALRLPRPRDDGRRRGARGAREGPLRRPGRRRLRRRPAPPPATTTGRLAPLRRVVSAEPVLAPEIAALSADVARRYAGTRADVLRLAVPPRHATAEKEASAPAPRPDVDPSRRREGVGRPRARRRLRRGTRRRGCPAGGLVGSTRRRLAGAARPGRGGDVRLRPGRAALRARRQGRRPGRRRAAGRARGRATTSR